MKTDRDTEREKKTKKEGKRRRKKIYLMKDSQYVYILRWEKKKTEPKNAREKWHTSKAKTNNQFTSTFCQSDEQFIKNC